MGNDDEINLYYVLAITPAAIQGDRFIFDGEVPFGVSVNQVLLQGSLLILNMGFQQI